MNDEVLIKSESAKDSLLYKVIFCLAISAIGALIFLIAPVEVWEYSGLKLIHYETRGFDAISSGHASVATIVGAVLFSSAFLTGVFFLVMYFYLGSCVLSGFHGFRLDSGGFTWHKM